MAEIVLALRRSLASLSRGRTWLYVLVPALLAVLCMAGLAFVFLQYLVGLLLAQPPMSWIAAWGAFWLAHFLAVIGGWLVILSLSYLLAVVLTALLVLPLMLKMLSQSDYADLARLGQDSFAASAWNSVWAALLFVLGWLATLPLWLVPGLGLVLPMFWMAWLNRRTFAYDVLAAHATAEEWRVLRQKQSMPLLALGVLPAALTHVPVLGLLAPSLAALAYCHFCLEALRRLRGGAVLSIPEKREEK